MPLPLPASARAARPPAAGRTRRSTHRASPRAAPGCPQDEVEAFLAAAEGGPEHPPAGADDDADFIPNEAEQDGEDEEEDEEGPSRKKKKAASGKAVASSPAARAGGAAASGQAYRLRLSDKPLKYLSVSTYKGRPQVDFREYYM